MSEFETTACKALGVILFLILVVLALQLIGCTCSVPEVPLEHEYIDEVKMENYA